MQTDGRRLHVRKIKILLDLKHTKVIVPGYRVVIVVSKSKRNFSPVFFLFGQRLQVVIATWSEETR